MARLTAGRPCTYVNVPVSNWDDDLTPWLAPGLYRGDAAFGGHAEQTCRHLFDEVVPSVERAYGLAPRARGLAGYSLAGLFSLYAFARHEDVAAAAGVSPSVWYDGWVPFLQAAPLPGAGRFAYLSVGSQEKRGSPARLRTVEDDLLQTARILEGDGAQVVYTVGPGNHFQHVEERLAAALDALDGFLCRTPTEKEAS